MMAISVTLWSGLAWRTAVADWRQRYAAALLSALDQLLRKGAVNVVLVGIVARQGDVHRPELVLEHLVLLVCLAGILGFTSKTNHFVLVVEICVLEELNVLDCCKAVSNLQSQQG